MQSLICKLQLRILYQPELQETPPMPQHFTQATGSLEWCYVIYRAGYIWRLRAGHLVRLDQRATADGIDLSGRSPFLLFSPIPALLICKYGPSQLGNLARNPAETGVTLLGRGTRNDVPVANQGPY